MRQFQHLILIVSLSISSFASAQDDTTRLLKEIKVNGKIIPLPAKSVLPVQVLSGNDLENINGNNIADAAKYFSGVQIKDYGGIGGLKTISVRSLGANHTGVSYDGIMLNDAQNGQIDLGKFSLDNVEQITLYNAQPTSVLQTARAFSYAAVLALKTAQPLFNDSEKIKLNASINTGSFGLINPSVTIQNKLNSKLTSSLNAAWEKANGEYNFTYLNGSVTEKGRRTNADINAFHAAYNLRYAINDSNVVNTDVYYYHSQRGLPGAIIFYSGQGTQWQWDDNFFVQTSWRKKLSSKSELLISGKYNYSYYDYLDTTYSIASSLRESVFRQKELYVSGTYSYQIFSFAKLAYASDFFADRLLGNQTNFATPTRNTFLNNLSTQLLFSQLQIDGNVLSTTINNKVEYGPKPSAYQHFSPTIEFIYQPLNNLPLSIRAFYKDIFRIPTFNDIYYSEVPNVSLKPENAKQYNLGLTWNKISVTSFINSLSFTADAYYNHVNNLIVARPGTNIGRWNMENDGEVDIKGLDLNTKIVFKSIGDFSWSLNANYTYQQALNMDKKYSQTYKNQIPYMPKDFGSFNIQTNYKNFTLSCNAIFSGYRYSLDQNLYNNLLQAWNTQDVLLSYHFQGSKNCLYKIVFQLSNLFNQQYQIIQYYPMPGRNYKVGIYWYI